MASNGNLGLLEVPNNVVESVGDDLVQDGTDELGDSQGLLVSDCE